MNGKIGWNWKESDVIEYIYLNRQLLDWEMHARGMCWTHTIHRMSAINAKEAKRKLQGVLCAWNPLGPRIRFV